MTTPTKFEAAVLLLSRDFFDILREQNVVSTARQLRE